MSAPVWLTTDEIAERYRTTVDTVWYWRAQDPPYGPPGVRLGRRVLYRLTDVEAWEAAQTAAASGDELAAHAARGRGRPRRARGA